MAVAKRQGREKNRTEDNRTKEGQRKVRGRPG